VVDWPDLAVDDGRVARRRLTTTEVTTGCLFDTARLCYLLRETAAALSAGSAMG